MNESEGDHFKILLFQKYEGFTILQLIYIYVRAGD